MTPRDDEYGDFESIEDPFEEKTEKEVKKPAPPTVKRVRKENDTDTDPGQVVKTKDDIAADKLKSKP